MKLVKDQHLVYCKFCNKPLDLQKAVPMGYFGTIHDSILTIIATCDSCGKDNFLEKQGWKLRP